MWRHGLVLSHRNAATQGWIDVMNQWIRKRARWAAATKYSKGVQKRAAWRMMRDGVIAARRRRIEKTMQTRTALAFMVDNRLAELQYRMQVWQEWAHEVCVCLSLSLLLSLCYSFSLPLLCRLCDGAAMCCCAAVLLCCCAAVLAHVATHTQTRVERLRRQRILRAALKRMMSALLVKSYNSWVDFTRRRKEFIKFVIRVQKHWRTYVAAPCLLPASFPFTILNRVGCCAGWAPGST